MKFCKPIGLLLLILCCTLAGAQRGRQYFRRSAALEDAKLLALFLREQLAFTLAPPAQLLASALSQSVFSGCDYLAQACRSQDTGPLLAQAWKRAVDQSAEPFMQEDRILVARIGSILGTSDLESQRTQLFALAGRLERQAGLAADKARTNARLSLTLGGLLGAAMAVLLL